MVYIMVANSKNPTYIYDHIDIQYFDLQDLVDLVQVVLDHNNTELNISYISTK